MKVSLRGSYIRVPTVGFCDRIGYCFGIASQNHFLVVGVYCSSCRRWWLLSRPNRVFEEIGAKYGDQEVPDKGQEVEFYRQFELAYCGCLSLFICCRASTSCRSSRRRLSTLLLSERLRSAPFERRSKVLRLKRKRKGSLRRLKIHKANEALTAQRANMDVEVK